MIRTTFRYLVVAAIAATLVFLALALAPKDRAENAKFAVCQSKITSKCLTDLGVDLALNDTSLPRYMREVGMLAQMGRLEDAFTLEHRIEEAKGRSAENMEGTVNRRLASHRITAAIRRGESLQRAVDGTPSMTPSALWISALDLLGRSPYGVTTGLRHAPDTQTLIILLDMTEMIAAMSRDGAERHRITHFVHAAELQAAFGNRAEVIQLLEELPQTEDLHINLTENLIRLIGAKTALRLYNEAGGNRSDILLSAASAEADSAQSAAYLKRAFAEFAAKKPWPDFDWMERTVKRSVDLGHAELALQLARELALKAQTDPSGIPVFPHIKATRSLMAAGADEIEVRLSLGIAEGALPPNEKVVAIGFVSGPIAWGSSGLDAQARREIANLRGRLGDLETAIRLMDGIKNPVFAWNDMLTPDIPLEYLNTLLDAAGVVLSTEDLSYVRAQLAAEMSRTDKTGAQISWALSTAADILQAEQFDGSRAVTIYTSLTRVGARTEDPNIEGLALTRMAQAALETRDFSDLIRTGFQWYQSDIAP